MIASDSARVSVAQAAQELGLDPATVRYWMETGQLPIGIVVKPTKGRKHKRYLIYRPKLDAVIGRTGGDYT